MRYTATMESQCLAPNTEIGLVAKARGLSAVAANFKKKKKLLSLGRASAADMHKNRIEINDLIESKHVYAGEPEFMNDLQDAFAQAYRPIDICDAGWYMMYPQRSHITDYRKALEAGTKVSVEVPDYLSTCQVSLRMQWMRENGSIHGPVSLADLMQNLKLPADILSDISGLLEIYTTSSEGQLKASAEPETIKYIHDEMHKWIDFDHCVEQQIDAENDKAFNTAASKAGSKLLKTWSARTFS